MNDECSCGQKCGCLQDWGRPAPLSLPGVPPWPCRWNGWFPIFVEMCVCWNGEREPDAVDRVRVLCVSLGGVLCPPGVPGEERLSTWGWGPGFELDVGLSLHEAFAGSMPPLQFLKEKLSKNLFFQSTASLMSAIAVFEGETFEKPVLPIHGVSDVRHCSFWRQTCRRWGRGSVDTGNSPLLGLTYSEASVAVPTNQRL